MLDLPLRLLDERAHRQAEDQAPWPRVILFLDPVPEPRDRDARGLAKPGGDANESILADAFEGQAPLPAMLRMAGEAPTEIVEPAQRQRLQLTTLTEMWIAALLPVRAGISRSSGNRSRPTSAD